MTQDMNRPEAVSQAEMVAMATSCPCLNIRKAARAVTQLYDAVLQPSGLRATQFSLLGAIALAGEPTLTRLAEDLVMDQTTLTRNLKLLERRGFIAIAAGEDRRTRVVAMTSAGRQALVAALPLWHEARSRVVAQMGDEQWRTLFAGLQSVTRLASPS